MKVHSKNNSGKKENKLFGKRSFLMYAMLALVVVTAAAAAVTIAPGGSENSSAAGTWTGSGLVNDPYQVSSVEDLAALADDVNNNDNPHTGDWFILTTDLDLNYMPWTPIGSITDNFSGNFDGDGHTVSNLFINTGGNIGLFGEVSVGTIENLGVLDVEVSGSQCVGGLVGSVLGNCTIENCFVTGTVTGSGDNVGGVVGCIIDGTVDNCYNTGDVTGGEGSSVGGVVGDNNGTVVNCYNTGTVTINGGGRSVGGVTGSNENSGTLENCYNTGTVTMNGSGGNCGGVAGFNGTGTVENCYNAGDVNGSTGVGGVIGWSNYGTVRNCYNTGAVNGSGNGVGGVVGDNRSTVENCCNTGDVNSSTGSSVGGVAGYNEPNITVENCYNTGTVTLTGGGSNAGGVAGNNYGNVENCYNTGVVSLDGGGDNAGGVIGYSSGIVENCYNIGDVSLEGGGNNAGGVAGSNYATVESCYNIGDVYLDGGGSNAGGVAGNNGDTVDNCYNTGVVSITASGSNAGGVVGSNIYGRIDNCYNTGVVSLPGSGSNAGGVVGSNDSGTIDNCFFLDDGHDGIGNQPSNTTDAAAINDTAMRTQGTFPSYSTSTGKGWDFSGISGAPPIWFILEGKTYPKLFWQIADSGSGADADHPYVVTTMQQIENIQNVFVANGLSDGKYWQLGKDIDATGYFAEKGPGYNSGAGWVPIGDDTNQFQGSFDGNRHTITGLFIYDTDLVYTGLFGYIVTGTITNLGVTNVDIIGGSYVGGVAGYVEGGTISNCFVTGAVSGGYYVGGVAGVDDGTVENCYNTGAVTGSNSVGGVVGYDTVISTVENCYNTGPVTITGLGGYNVGGVVGYNDKATVENCYNTGSVTLTGGGDYVGGVVGRNEGGMVENCYNTGAVSLLGSGFYAGGVVGYNLYSGGVVDCFFKWEEGVFNSSLYGIGYDSVSTGAARTSDSELQTQSTYPVYDTVSGTGWNFDNVWGMYTIGGDTGNPGYGYPYLKTIGNNVLITPDGGTKIFDGNPAPVPTWTSNDTYDISLFIGSLSYDPAPATNANTYNITLGTLDSPYYQVRFQDDVQYKIWSKDQIADSGSGLETDPYIVTTMEQIENIQNYFVANNLSGGVYWQLGNDIDATSYFASGGPGYNGGAGWVPIGDGTNPFEGSFDGNGHTITGLVINDTGLDNTGLFSYVNKGEIMNLGLVNAKITGRNFVGGVVGILQGGSIENCFVTGTVSGSGDVGGVVGENIKSSIENCYNTSDVNIRGNYVGGVVGYNTGTVDNCYNTGAVTGIIYYVGGVVGYNTGTVDNCYNTGAVSSGTTSSNIGGVVGYNTGGTVENCYATGTVSGTTNVGGVAGYSNVGTVENCFFKWESGVFNSTLHGIGNTGLDTGAARTSVADLQTENKYPPYDTLSGKGWDFDSIWGLYTISGDTSISGYGYPYLKTIDNFILITPDGGSKDFDGTPAPEPTWTSDNPSDKSLFKGSLSYNPTPAINVNMYNITLGDLDSPYYQIRFQDDIQYEIQSSDQIADSGSGSDTDPFIVTTLQQIENIENLFVMNNDSSDMYWQLGGDLDLTGYFDNGNPGYNGGAGWVPIGNDTHPFEGSFDGNGHTITGLVINDTDLDYAGLLGYVYNGEIMNLGVINANITGGYFVGGVVGNLQGGSVENCFVAGNGNIYGSGDNVGGVVGNNTGTIENCYNMISVSGSGDDVGGVVGANSHGTVMNCYNAGAVTGSGDDVGGVVGSNTYGTVKNCYNAGAVGGSITSIGVGGVVGWNDNSGTVASCFFLQYGLDGIGYDDYSTTAADATVSFEEGAPASTFIDAADWDFDIIWGMYVNTNDPDHGYGYPYLKTIENNVLITPDGGSKAYDGNPAPVQTWTSEDPFDISLFTGSLSYDPTPAITAKTYNITLGDLDSPYYQVRFQDDVQYEITPVSAGASYSITALSDSNSTITPSGQVSVQGGTSKTFTYSAASGYHISSVTVNGKDLSQEQITGSYTFTNVMYNNTIVVKSAPGSLITLTITIAQGSGYAEYSVNGSDFVRYSSPVPLNASDSVTVRAVAGDGYSFVKWETPATETALEITLSATSSLSLKAYFSDSSISPGSNSNGGSSNSDLWIWALAVIIVLIIIGAIIWYVFKIKK